MWYVDVEFELFSVTSIETVLFLSRIIKILSKGININFISETFVLPTIVFHGTFSQIVSI